MCYIENSDFQICMDVITMCSLKRHLAEFLGTMILAPLVSVVPAALVYSFPAGKHTEQ